MISQSNFDLKFFAKNWQKSSYLQKSFIFNYSGALFLEEKITLNKQHKMFDLLISKTTYFRRALWSTLPVDPNLWFFKPNHFCQLRWSDCGSRKMLLVFLIPRSLEVHNMPFCFSVGESDLTWSTLLNCKRRSRTWSLLHLSTVAACTYTSPYLWFLSILRLTFCLPLLAAELK